MTENLSCKNCGASLTGKYCHNCGQKSYIHKITVSYLVHELSHALTHADKGILFLAREMLYRPGNVAAEYIEGKRKKYFNPLSFLVIVSALFALAASKSGYFEAQGDLGARPLYPGMPASVAHYLSESMRIIVSHGKMISIFIIVPILTLLSWLFFKRTGYNFAENLVLQSLIMGQVHLVMVIVFIPAYLLFGYPSLNNSIFQATFFVYMITAYYQFFRNNIVLTIIKTLFIQFLFIVLFWITVVTFVIIKTQVLRLVMGHE